MHYTKYNLKEPNKFCQGTKEPNLVPEPRSGQPWYILVEMMVILIMVTLMTPYSIILFKLFVECLFWLSTKYNLHMLQNVNLNKLHIQCDAENER